MSTKLRYNSQKSSIFNKNIDQALQECNLIGVTDVSTQGQKREIPTALQKSSGDLPSSFYGCCGDIEGTPKKLMSEANFSPPFQGAETPSLLDKLAQPGTENINVLKKRALKKYVSNEIVYPLINQHSSLEASYWNTAKRCSNVLLQDGKKITGRYCNNRWCLVCNAIRTAKMINEYLPILLNEISDPYFVTLTIPNVPGKDLRDVVRRMIYVIIKINSTFRHRKDFRLKGIRKIECTHNPDTGLFHPHIHLYLSGQKAGEELINAWLRCYPEANRAAQDIRPADRGSLIELFKYTTKIVTGKNLTRQGDQVEININPGALDTIFRALQGVRVFQPMGIKKVCLSEDIDTIQSQEVNGIVSAIEVWGWEQDLSDWVSGSGELLTGSNANKHYKIIKR